MARFIPVEELTTFNTLSLEDEFYAAQQTSQGPIVSETIRYRKVEMDPEQYMNALCLTTPVHLGVLFEEEDLVLIAETDLH